MENIISGPPLLLKAPLLAEYLLRRLKNAGNKIVLVLTDCKTGQGLKASEILDKSIKLAKWMTSKDIKYGDCIAIISENRLEYLLPALAAIYNGVTFALLNPKCSSDDLAHGLNISKPKVVFISPHFIRNLGNLTLQYSFIQNQVVLEDRVSHPSESIGHIFNQSDIKNYNTDSFQPVKVDEETVAAIFSSSGTSGLPKGVMITQKNFISNILNLKQMLGLKVDENVPPAVIMCVAPMFHIMGWWITFYCAVEGNNVILMDRFDEELYYKSIEKYKVTNLSAPPALVQIMNKSAIAKQYDFSSVIFIKSGSAPLKKEAEEEITKLGLPPVKQSYGLTETTFVVTVSPPDGKPGSVGILVPGMKCKVIDSQGKALGPDQEGELCFKGSLIMKGYMGNPSATENSVDSDGWLHTGDIGHYDKDNFFYIVDRIKEVIKYKSFQVPPALLEGILMSHQAVLDCAVVGLLDDDCGELPLAFVVLKPNSSTSDRELVQYVNERVSQEKKLRGGVRFVKEIPRTDTGKVLRRVLKHLANSKAKL